LTVFRANRSWFGAKLELALMNQPNFIALPSLGIQRTTNVE
jgi:hypothetical protein